MRVCVHCSEETIGGQLFFGGYTVTVTSQINREKMILHDESSES